MEKVWKQRKEMKAFRFNNLEAFTVLRVLVCLGRPPRH